MNKRTKALDKEQYENIIATIRNGFEYDGHIFKPNNRLATMLVVQANIGVRISDIMQKISYPPVYACLYTKIEIKFSKNFLTISSRFHILFTILRKAQVLIDCLFNTLFTDTDILLCDCCA